MDNKKINFPETVMLIDATRMNIITTDIKREFEHTLKRPLPSMDIPELIVGLALDSGVREKAEYTQVIFVYDTATPKLTHCIPSDLDKELNGVAFQDKTLGEFALASCSPENITTREELFCNILQMISESPDVKRIIVAPFEESNLQAIHPILENIKGKKVMVFGMGVEISKSYRWEVFLFPALHAFGVRPDEIE